MTVQNGQRKQNNDVSNYIFICVYVYTYACVWVYVCVLQKNPIEALSKDEIISKYKGLLGIAKKAKQAKDGK